MKKVDVTVCFIWIILAMLVAFQSIRLKLGQLTDPGPGFLPFCSSIILGILAIILLVSQVSKKEKNETIKANGFRLGQQWTKAVYFMGSSFIYITILWKNLGYLIGTAIFLFFLLKFVGSQSFRRSIIISVTATAISYLIFETWLLCMLPKGLLKSLNF